MVIAVRKDIDIGKGKMAAQVAHAAVACALRASRERKKLFREWMSQGQKKIVIRVSDERELLELKRRVDAEGMLTETITDAGLTQIPPGTLTCMGIGPDESTRLDPLTGGYPLF